MKHVSALAIAGVFVAFPDICYAQDAQTKAVLGEMPLLTNMANSLGWADLALACHIRSEGWNKLIHDKATVSLFVLDEQLHLDGVHRDALGDTVHEMAADIGKSYGCNKVTSRILSALDKVAITP